MVKTLQSKRYYSHFADEKPPKIQRKYLATDSYKAFSPLFILRSYETPKETKNKITGI